MKREAFEKLRKWKFERNRKPLILRGARQVGKTWLMQEFGRTCYERTIYAALDADATIRALFEQDIEPERIIRGLELASGGKIAPDNTLIILDEIQEAPGALSSLKYFCERMPQYHIVAAGSLLGVALHEGTSFPVGKVDFLPLHPLTFREFLGAAGKGNLLELLETRDFELMKSFRQEFIECLKQYCFVGGMPEAAACFAANRDYAEAREIQRRILLAFEMDFSKHAPSREVPRLRMLWQGIPAQLAKENRKFVYGQLRGGARAKDYEMALLWLSDCGLIHRVSRVSKPGLPLRVYEDARAFKLYLLDVGLLAALSGLTPGTLLNGSHVFTEFKGALTEQYVCTQLVAAGMPLFYWTRERGSAEVDFITQRGEDVLPIEVKAETNLRAKSLKVYQEMYSPSLSVRTSMADYERQGWLLNLPLYAVSLLAEEGTL
ncbi:MAG: ATP-binding protein [Fretibacterium sp.]|nr:ATP-binding protein [Fretibacterium sp.]